MNQMNALREKSITELHEAYNALSLEMLEALANSSTEQMMNAEMAQAEIYCTVVERYEHLALWTLLPGESTLDGDVKIAADMALLDLLMDWDGQSNFELEADRAIRINIMDVMDQM